MNVDELRKFLVKAKKAGYASGGESVAVKESDGSKSTRFEEGNFKFHDNWFGNEPFGGREVVFYKNKPYWVMVYYGSDYHRTPGLIPVLLKALSSLPDEMPARGQKYLKDGDFEYRNNWKGDLESFSGDEVITYKGEKVYNLKYSGGLVGD